MPSKVYKLLFNVLAIAVCFMLVGPVSAAATDFNLTLPRFGGSAATNNIKKETVVASNDLTMTVGGGYTIWYRSERIDNAAASSWASNSSGTYSYAINIGVCHVGVQCHLRLQNKTSTPVAVQVIGNWNLK